MLQQLLGEITQYFDFLQQQGYYVSFHNLSIPMDSCMAALTPYNINSNPFCLLVKTSSEAWNYCIQRQTKVLAACAGGAFCGSCYAGMGEWVFPICSIEGTPLAFISVSGYRICDQKAYAQIGAVARRYGHSQQQLLDSYHRDLLPLPEKEQLAPLIAPLCRMFELLNVQLRRCEVGAVGSMTHSSILGHAVAYLRRNYNQPLSVEQVAQNCHCSVSSLSHLFKQKLGLSIRAYLRQLRLEDAKRLLRDTDLPINAISDLLGYGNPNYFCNVFRQETGVAPTLFRQQQKGQFPLSGLASSRSPSDRPEQKSDAVD